MSTDTKFDWSTVPDWVTFRAQDEDGSWFGYRFIPRTSLHNWKSAGGDVIRISEPEGRNQNWFMSLEMRPSCKQSTDCKKSVSKQVLRTAIDGSKQLFEIDEKSVKHASQVEKSDGSTASYYELPHWARELADLIRHKNMNGSQAEMFRAIYRGSSASHSDEKRQAKKLLAYAVDEVVRTHFPKESFAFYRNGVFEAIFGEQHEEPDLGTAVQALAEELNRKCRCEPKDPACKQWYDSLPKEEQDDGK